MSSVPSRASGPTGVLRSGNRCVVFVVSGEFITGIIVNKIMHWNVWDYTGMPFQLMGQICLPFAVIFSGLCAVGILVSGYLLHFFYGEEMPHFHVL